MDSGPFRILGVDVWFYNQWRVACSHFYLPFTILTSKHVRRCTVCLAEYNEEDKLRILPNCGHSFHASCIDIWLHKQSTCPVCRISLNELPERKRFMQPMFSSAIRPQYSMQSINVRYCQCLSNCHRHSPRSLDNQMPGPTQELQCRSEDATACWLMVI